MVLTIYCYSEAHCTTCHEWVVGSSMAGHIADHVHRSLSANKPHGFDGFVYMVTFLADSGRARRGRSPEERAGLAAPMWMQVNGEHQPPLTLPS